MVSQVTVDTVWLITASCLVFFMQAGFAMLEAGMVRSKNAVNVIMKNYIDMCFGAIGFWLVGFGLMFGTNPTGWIGTDFFMPEFDSNWDFSFLFYQMMFAATAATIVSGALAERIRYWAYVICAVVISSVIYPIFGSWVWGDFSGETSGWLKELGFIDFAGSTVVHSVGGWCALAGVIVLGPRMGRFGKVNTEKSQDSNADTTETNPNKIAQRYIPGHNLTLVALGGFILWMGWFGFNGGSLLEANARIGRIVLATHLSGSAGVVGAILLLVLKKQPILMGTAINGGLAGLVAICASADIVSSGQAILIGLMAGMLMVQFMNFFESLKLDDPLGAIAVHGISGAWGTLALPLLTFDIDQLLIQLTGVVVAFLWAFTSSLGLFWGLNKLSNIRIKKADERRGLDYTEHYEISYPEFQRELLHSGKE